jgi:hypothetical protein
MRRILTTYGIISLLLSVALIVGAVSMLTSLTAYRDPYPVGQDFSATRRGPTLAEHVVVVVIDGLRVDAARGLSSFQPATGARSVRTGVVSVSQPSYSKPTWSVICTGAGQAITGVAMNTYAKPFISNIFSEAKASGRSTALVGSDWWEPLIGPWADQKHIYVYEEDEALTVRSTLDFAPRTALTLAYFATPDEVAHDYGSDSPQYAAAVAKVDAAVQELIGKLDLSTTTVIVTADHGHIAAGGHGGPEADVVQAPIAVWGDRVTGGPELAVKQTDIAPTVAALLGTTYPDFVQGRPLLEAFDVDPLERELITANWATQVEMGTVALLPALGVTAVPVTASEPAARANEFLAQYDLALTRRAAADGWNAGRWIAAVAILVLGLALAIWLHRLSSGIAVAGSAVGLATALVAVAAGKLRPSFSTLDSPTALIMALAAYAGLGLLAVLAAQYLAWRLKRTVSFSQWAVALIQVQLVWFAVAIALHALRGPFLISAYMPDFTYWLLKVYVSAYAAIGNVVMLLGLVPIYFLSRWTLRHAWDAATRIAPPTIGLD